MPTTKPTLLGTYTAGSLIPTANYNSQVMDKARWEQESLAGTGNDKISTRALRSAPDDEINLLCNGSFESFGFGVGPWSIAQGAVVFAYAMEGWQLNSGVASTASTAAGLYGTTAISLNAAGSGIFQAIEGGAMYRRMPLTLSCWMNGGAGHAGVIQLSDGVNTYQVSGQGTGSWEFVSAWGTIDPSATNIFAALFAPAGLCAFDGVMLTAGYGTASFHPNTFASESFRIARRHQFIHTSLRGRALAASQEWIQGYHISPMMPNSAVGNNANAPFFTKTDGTVGNTTTNNHAPIGSPVAGVRSDSLTVHMASTAGSATPGTDTFAIDDLYELTSYPY